jgi:hypothetical protein
MVYWSPRSFPAATGNGNKIAILSEPEKLFGKDL